MEVLMGTARIRWASPAENGRTRLQDLVVVPRRAGSMPKFMALHEHDRSVTC